MKLNELVNQLLFSKYSVQVGNDKSIARVLSSVESTWRTIQDASEKAESENDPSLHKMCVSIEDFGLFSHYYSFENDSQDVTWGEINGMVDRLYESYFSFIHIGLEGKVASVIYDISDAYPLWTVRHKFGSDSPESVQDIERWAQTLNNVASIHQVLSV